MRNIGVVMSSLVVLAIALFGCTTQDPVEQDTSSDEDVVDRQTASSPGDEIPVPQEFTMAASGGYETCSCGFECQYYTCECNGSTGCCSGCCETAEEAEHCDRIVVRPKHPVVQ